MSEKNTKVLSLLLGREKFYLALCSNLLKNLPVWNRPLCLEIIKDFLRKDSSRNLKNVPQITNKHFLHCAIQGSYSNDFLYALARAFLLGGTSFYFPFIGGGGGFSLD